MGTINALSTDAGVWINQPDVFFLEGDELRFITGPGTDFWQRTYYGFQLHSGHAFGYYVEGDFMMQVKITAEFSHLYDQAGIFLQDNDTHWIKAGVEFNDGQPSIGCVVTRGLSDWSTGIFPGEPDSFWMRATLEKEALRIQYSADGETWPLLRLCHLPERKRLFVGVMACTPERQGLEATFSGFIVTTPSGKPLHDLT